MFCKNCGTPISRGKSGEWEHDAECPKWTPCHDGNQGPEPEEEARAPKAGTPIVTVKLKAGGEHWFEADSIVEEGRTYWFWAAGKVVGAVPIDAVETVSVPAGIRGVVAA